MSTPQDVYPIKILTPQKNQQYFKKVFIITIKETTKSQVSLNFAKELRIQVPKKRKNVLHHLH